ncbi:eCIS core domain-containing protein [Aquimarina algiphila]|uniref:eCIS core domain-containing protein n=1 Tax=Aquimarina algiphila TaxID=2047982 RepID=UPI00232BBA5A|nr:DUF4157 domain-containing protein [Aquimarina algiphila]
MKAPLENIQESQKNTVQRVQQEPRTDKGGEATIVDNRPAIAIQRKLRSAMGSAEDTTNPIQYKNKTGLPNKLKSGIENLSGYSMDDVKVHYNSSKPAQLHAHAYAQGTDIHLAPGQQKHLPHEAWHVVQQKQGRVQPTRQLKSKVNINDDAGLEREADVMGARAQGLTNFRGESSPNQNYEEGRMTPTRQLKNKVNSNYKVGFDKNLNSLLAIQRVIKTVSDFKKYNDVMDMTVTQLLAYANKQADWHRGVKDQKERFPIISLLSFLRNNHGVDGACGDFKLLDLWTKIKNTDGSDTIDPNKSAEIMAYTRGVQKKSAHCEKQTDIDIALDFGKNILKLEKKLSPNLLAHIFTDEMFGHLYKFNGVNRVEDFITYYDTCKPHLAAKNGREIWAYLSLKINDGVDPVIYNDTVIKGPIRNYHRFEKNALDKLKENFENTSKEKPLTLILHSQLDHNGAFFRDSKLTKLITNSELYVLMIEGEENLASAKTKMNAFLGTHAKDGVIDQVMIAGHGNARSIEVTGMTNDYKENTVEGINLINSSEFLDDILEKLVKKTGKDKAVVVFNACLTNSNSVDISKINLTNEVVNDAAEIRKYITENPSLATYVTKWAAGKGIEIESVGSSASTTSGGDFFDSENRLTLEDDKDPKFIAPKLEYVKEGIEPTGALRAALETWADVGGTGPALAAIKNRADKGNDSKWPEQLIRSLFARIDDKYKSSALGIARLVNIAEALSEFTSESGAQYKYLHQHKLHTEEYKDDALYTINKMSTTDEYKSEDYIPLGLFQLQIKHGIDKKKDLLEQLGKFNYRMVKKYNFLAISELDLDNLIPDTEAKDPSHGQLLLAIWAMAKKEERGKAFLNKHLDDLEKFPEKDKIDDILGGYASENRILIFIGKMNDSSPGEKRANVQVDGETTNTIYVTPMTRKGEINESSTFIRKEPDEFAELQYFMSKGNKVYIFGGIGDWYAIEYGFNSISTTRKTGFVKKDRVDIT